MHAEQMSGQIRATAGRVPPYDDRAEVAVLGSVLINNGAMALVASSLQPEDFYVEAHRRIFAAMLEVNRTGGVIDVVTLGDALDAEGNLAKIGGAIALTGLTDGVATAAHIEHYANIVRQKAAVRSMIYAAQEVVANGFGGVPDTEEYLAQSRADITQAAQFVTGAGPQRIDQDVLDEMNYLQAPGDPPGLVRTGIGMIDNVTGGLWPGLMTVVAGRPSMGKSAFMINIACNAALNGYKVLYVTLEDTRRFVVKRLLSRYGDVDLHDLTLRNVKDPDAWKRLMDAANQLTQKHPLWVEDAGGLTSAAVAQIAAAHKSLHGLDLLVVDHLGEVADTGESETSITTRAAQRFRDIAKELDIPVLLASQLNRKVEERPDKRPLLSDLRQSGAIEALARVVWFLYRPAYYLPDDEAEGRKDLQLLVAKASHGKTGMLRLWIDLSRMYVRDWDTQQDGDWPDQDTKPAAPGKPQQNYFGIQHPSEPREGY